MTEKGSDMDIYFDPDEKGEEILNEDGTYGRSALIGLGHELGHALQGMFGKQNAYKSSTAIDPDNGIRGKMSFEEIRNREQIDNPIRAEQGEKQRATVRY